MIPPEQVELVNDFASFGVYAFTTTRNFGSFGTDSDEPVKAVMARWRALRETAAARGVKRLASANQVHGAKVLVHGSSWEGWLRTGPADGHAAIATGTALAVTVADCVPVFLAHPSGAVALLHSGWRGTAARIVKQGIATLERSGLHPGDIRAHLGPAICGACYEVSPDVYRQVTGLDAGGPKQLDLRAVIAQQARSRGITQLTVSDYCTKCDNQRFYSHRAGDAGRQVAVIMAAAS